MNERHIQQNEKNNVVYMDRQQANHQMAHRLSDKKENSRQTSLRKIIVFVLGFIVLGMISLSFLQTRRDLKTTQTQLSEVEALEQTVRQELEATQDAYQHMQDPDYLADVARRDYFYSKPGEIIFDLNDGEQ